MGVPWFREETSLGPLRASSTLIRSLASDGLCLAYFIVISRDAWPIQAWSVGMGTLPIAHCVAKVWRSV
jgi:hypothetical protein